MTDVRQQTIPATVHGTYYLAGPDDAGALVVGFHGYGETARDHLEALQRIPGSQRWLLCAVQGLHPFYRRNGDVVASWMTSFDREHAIADNVAYAASVVERVRLDRPSVERLAFTGFSQGVAMAWRAAVRGGHHPHAVAVLAGDVPPALADDAFPPDFPPVLLGAGRDDQWYTEDKLQADLELLRGKNVSVEPLVFDGGHEWGEAYLQRAGEYLGERLQA